MKKISILIISILSLIASTACTSIKHGYGTKNLSSIIISQNASDAVKVSIISENKDSKGSRKATFISEVANDDNKRAIGLMFRDTIQADGAMLFIFDNETIVEMWMKNTYFELDMLFIDSSNRIVKIAKHVPAMSLDIISSETPVTRVMEIKAGMSDKFKIEVGDLVSVNI